MKTLDAVKEQRLPYLCRVKETEAAAEAGSELAWKWSPWAPKAVKPQQHATQHILAQDISPTFSLLLGLTSLSCLNPQTAAWASNEAGEKSKLEYSCCHGKESCAENSCLTRMTQHIQRLV